MQKLYAYVTYESTLCFSEWNYPYSKLVKTLIASKINLSLMIISITVR